MSENRYNQLCLLLGKLKTAQYKELLFLAKANLRTSKRSMRLKSLLDKVEFLLLIKLGRVLKSHDVFLKNVMTTQYLNNKDKN